MKILYYDCFAGISGDMNLAAMIDLGVEPAFLLQELAKLGLNDEFELKHTPAKASGIAGTRVDVVLQKQHSDHAHHHRNFADIEKIITTSTLTDQVKATSMAIFSRIARAEARVHGCSLKEVHFHEVGATDSIIDVVGAAVCKHALDVEAIWSRPVELGGGFVRCAHGMMPVPAPATIEILSSIPTTRMTNEHESTTPTGAAILAELVDHFIDAPALTILENAYGIGHRETKIPNMLRVQLAEASSPFLICHSRLLQCNIDDMTAEQLGLTMDILLQAGAMDVHFTPIVMKKNRPATQLSLLCAAAEEKKFKQLIFRHTTTLGLKSFPLDKTVLEATFNQVDTPWGTVHLKHGLLDGQVVKTKPELEDCRKIIEEQGLSLGELYAHICTNR